ncbi:hypothetical protein [Oceanotoga phage vB_OteS-UFV02]
MLNWLKSAIDMPIKLVNKSQKAFSVIGADNENIFNIDTLNNSIDGYFNLPLTQINSLYPSNLTLPNNVWRNSNILWKIKDSNAFELSELSDQIIYKSTKASLINISTFSISSSTNTRLTITLQKNGQRINDSSAIIDIGTTLLPIQVLSVIDIQEGDILDYAVYSSEGATINIELANSVFLALKKSQG